MAVPVTVQRGGRPVRGLGRADFDLLDNGVQQSVELESVTSLPLDVDLVIDWSELGRMYPRVRTAPAEVAGRLRPGDTLRTIVFDTEIHEWPVLSVAEGTDLSGALPDLDPPNRVAGGRYSTWDRHVHPRLEDPAMSDALMLALARRSPFGRGHLVLAFAWGHDNGSVGYLRSRLAPIAARSDAVMHVARFDPRSIANMSGGLLQRWLRRDIEDAVEASGGRIWNIRDGAAAFGEMLDQFRQSYILRYTATGVDPGGWHEVTVRVPAHPEYEIGARKGYLGR